MPEKAPLTGHAAVGVDDDFAPGEAAIPQGAAGDKATGGVDVVFGVIEQPGLRQHRLDDVLQHRRFQLFLADIGIVLGGQHHGVEGEGLAVLVVAQGYLALGVRAQPGQGALPADFRLLAHQAVGEVDGGRHQGIGLVAGVAEHQALVTGALVFRAAAVDTLVDILGLGPEGVQYRTGGVVEALVGAVVTDIPDGIADDFFNIHRG